MAFVARQYGVEQGKRGDRPQADDRLIYDIGGGWLKRCTQFGRYAERINAQAQNLIKTGFGGIGQRARKSCQRAHVGPWPVADALMSGVLAAHNDQRIALCR